MDTSEHTTVEPPPGSSTYDGFISYSHAADDLLAPRLQAGLQKFAKPWWKRRAVRIFRDESSLAANPHLWSSITEALDDSSWFVLLLSPDAASSEWVGKEIEHWVANKDSDRILPVVTDGEFTWENGDVSGSSVPPALHGVFTEEPRWVDLRFARGEEHLDLQNPDFSAAIADIASTIRGVPKDELASEEVRQHRRTVRTAWAAGTLVTVLAIAAVVAGIFAIGQRNDAQDNAALARDNAIEAEQNAAAEAEARREADANAILAERNAEDSNRNALLAEARELAASAINILDTDPELSILLALEAVDRAGEDRPPIESLVAVREATFASRIISRFENPGLETGRYGALSPDGTRIAWLSADSVTVRIFDSRSFEELWSYAEEDSPDFGDTVYFSADGTQVVFNVVDSSEQGFSGTQREGPPDDRWARLVILDADSGEAISRWEPESPCPGFLLGPQAPDGSVWPIVQSDDPNCGISRNWQLNLLDSNTLDPILSLPATGPTEMTWSSDATRLSMSSFFGLGTTVHDVSTGELLVEIPDDFFGELSPDGRTVAVGNFEPGGVVSLFDVESGRLVDRLTGLGDTPFDFDFTPDGSRLIAGSRGNAAAVWDLESGLMEARIPAVGNTVWASHDAATERYFHLGETVLTAWDIGSGSREDETHSLAGVVQGNAFTANGTQGAFLQFVPEPTLVTFDPKTGTVLDQSLPVDMGEPPAILEDGRLIVRGRQGSYSDPDQLIGPALVWDPTSGLTSELFGCAAQSAELEETVRGGLSGPCADGSGEWIDVDRFFVDPTNSKLLVSIGTGELVIFDTSTLDVSARYQFAGSGGVVGYGGSWLAVSSNPTGVTSQSEETTFYTLPSLKEVKTVPGRNEETSRDGSMLALHDRPGGVTIYDTTSWTAISSPGFGDARVRGMAFSPDGSRFMSSGTDGFVRVWDTANGTELDRIPLDGVSDGYWLDDLHIAVGTSGGLWTVLSLDIEEVLNEARARLTRGLSGEECVTYRIDPCPAEDG